jgi:hypothetical protein
MEQSAWKRALIGIVGGVRIRTASVGWLAEDRWLESSLGALAGQRSVTRLFTNARDLVWRAQQGLVLGGV